MNSIFLKIRVESDTLVVPALNNLLGKQVEIISSIIMGFLWVPREAMLETMVREDAAICGVTRAEVLHGARDEGHFGALANALSDFQAIKIKERHWSSIASNFA